jgi:N-acetylmuramoyl-L-alanine amidase
MTFGKLFAFSIIMNRSKIYLQMRNLLFLLLLLFTHLSFGQKSNVTIVLDPGHGGKDPGHLPHDKHFQQEKALTLIISKKLENYLTNNLTNVKVVQTRTTDTYPSLDKRVEIANNKNDDLFLSLHINGNPKSNVRGTETHIHNRGSKKALKLANYIERQFKTRAGRKSRGVKTSEDRGGNFQVLKFTKMPSVLVECGFITNQGEGAYLNSTYGQEIIASAIFRAIRKYLIETYPAIKFMEKPSNKNSNKEDGLVYKVQIMAALDPVDLDIPEFKKLPEAVERVKIDSKSMYKYKYFIGKFKTQKDAKKMQKKAKDAGFKDAFLVRIE